MANTRKRLLSLALSLVMALSLIPATALAEGEKVYGVIEVIGGPSSVLGGSCTLTGSSGEVIVLESYGGTAFYFSDVDGIPAGTYDYAITMTGLKNKQYSGSGQIVVACDPDNPFAEVVWEVPVEEVQTNPDGITISVMFKNTSSVTDEDIDWENGQVTLVNEMGDATPLSYAAMSRLYTATVPSGAYSLEVEVPLSDGSGRFSRTIWASDLKTDQIQAGSQKMYIVSLTDSHLVIDGPGPVDPAITVLFTAQDNKGNVLPNASIKVMIGDQEYFFTADSNGQVTAKLPRAERYLVGVVKDNAWSHPAEVPLSVMEAGSYTVVYTPPQIKDPIDGVTLQINVYVEGELWRSQDVEMQFLPDTTHHFTSGVYYDGVAECRDVRVLVDGAPYSAGNWGWSDGEDIANLSLNTAGLDENDSVVIDLDYYYIDTDTNYEITVTHEFYASTGAETPVYREQGTAVLKKAGEAFAINALTSKEEPAIRKEIAGYESSLWHLGIVRLEGGKPNSLVGEFVSTGVSPEDPHVVKDVMIHSDASVTFQYFRQPLYTVTWVDYDGTVLEKDEGLVYGTDPSYDGAKPTRPPAGNYIYTFIGWTPQIVPVTGDAVYTATYQAIYIPPYIPPTDPGTDIEDPDVPLADLPGLNTVDHYAYIAGYPDGTVQPNGNITRAEVATIFFRLFTDEYRQTCWTTSNPFSDVAFAAWYNNGVSTTANAGIVKGYPDGTFLPNNNITRGEFATIAARFLSDAYTGPDLFTDISGHWAAEYINRAASMGWINGYPDGSFRPDAYITRAEAMTLVNNMLGRAPHKDHLLPDMKVWPDNLEAAWYYEAVQEATNRHDYDWAGDKETAVYEIWTEILPERDWAALEKEWSNAYSSTGGDVIDNMNTGR